MQSRPGENCSIRDIDMPKAYEQVRDSYRKRGASIDDAKKWAAMWWNSHHPNNPNPWLKEEGVKKRRKR